LKDKEAFKCKVCMQTFMSTSKMMDRYTHQTSRHPTVKPEDCFPDLKGFDPLNPPDEKKKGSAAPKPKGPSKKKAAKGDELAALLDAGLSIGKSKKKK